MKQDETKKMISEIEMAGLMGKIIDHCFHRWSEKEMLIANRIKFFLEVFITHKLATQRKQLVEERKGVLNKLWLRLNTAHKECIAIKTEGAVGVMHIPLDCIKGEINSLESENKDA